MLQFISGLIVLLGMAMMAIQVMNFVIFFIKASDPRSVSEQADSIYVVGMSVFFFVVSLIVIYGVSLLAG